MRGVLPEEGSSLLALHMEEAVWQGMRQPLGAERSPQKWTCSKGAGTSILQSQGTEFYHNHVSLEQDLERHMRTQPSGHLDFGLVKLHVENIVIP